MNGLGGHEFGGTQGQRYVKSQDPRSFSDTPFGHKTLPIENHLIRTFSSSCYRRKFRHVEVLGRTNIQHIFGS